MRFELAATTFVYNGNRFALHLHPKVGKWLPPGGHVENHELPHDAAIREVIEELGIVPKLFVFDEPSWGIQTVPMPLAILVEPIDYEHSHIDMIYLATTDQEKIYDPFIWVALDEAVKLDAPEDVLRLAEKGLELIKNIY